MHVNDDVGLVCNMYIWPNKSGCINFHCRFTQLIKVLYYFYAESAFQLSQPVLVSLVFGALGYQISYFCVKSSTSCLYLYLPLMPGSKVFGAIIQIGGNRMMFEGAGKVLLLCLQ